MQCKRQITRSQDWFIRIFNNKWSLRGSLGETGMRGREKKESPDQGDSLFAVTSSCFCLPTSVILLLELVAFFHFSLTNYPFLAFSQPLWVRLNSWSGHVIYIWPTHNWFMHGYGSQCKMIERIHPESTKERQRNKKEGKQEIRVIDWKAQTCI